MKIIYETTIQYNPYRIIKAASGNLVVEVYLVGIGTWQAATKYSDKYNRVVCEALEKNAIKLVEAS